MADDWNATADRALSESLAHWQRVASDTMRDGEGVCTADCACCRVWYAAGCRGCPIAVRSGWWRCVGTPYATAVDEYEEREAGGAYDQTALDAMVTYLQTTLAMVRSGELAPK